MKEQFPSEGNLSLYEKVKDYNTEVLRKTSNFLEDLFDKKVSIDFITENLPSDNEALLKTLYTSLEYIDKAIADNNVRQILYSLVIYLNKLLSVEFLARSKDFRTVLHLVNNLIEEYKKFRFFAFKRYLRKKGFEDEDIDDLHFEDLLIWEDKLKEEHLGNYEKTLLDLWNNFLESDTLYHIPSKTKERSYKYKRYATIKGLLGKVLFYRKQYYELLSELKDQDFNEEKYEFLLNRIQSPVLQEVWKKRFRLLAKNNYLKYNLAYYLLLSRSSEQSQLLLDFTIDQSKGYLENKLKNINDKDLNDVLDKELKDIFKKVEDLQNIYEDPEQLADYLFLSTDKRYNLDYLTTNTNFINPNAIKSNFDKVSEFFTYLESSIEEAEKFVMESKSKSKSKVKGEREKIEKDVEKKEISISKSFKDKESKLIAKLKELTEKKDDKKSDLKEKEVEEINNVKSEESVENNEVEKYDEEMEDNLEIVDKADLTQEKKKDKRIYIDMKDELMEDEAEEEINIDVKKIRKNLLKKFKVLERKNTTAYHQWLEMLRSIALLEGIYSTELRDILANLSTGLLVKFNKELEEYIENNI